MSSMLFTMLGSAGLYGLALPLLILAIFTLLAQVSLKRPGAHLEGVGKALFCYAAQTAGLVLMLAGGIPTMYSVLGFQPLSGGTYLSLLLLFTVGGLTYMWHDTAARSIDAASRAVPHMIFVCTWKLIGLALILFGVLSAGIQAFLGGIAFLAGSWALHLGYICAGFLLLHLHFEEHIGPTFRSQPMIAAKVHKPAAAKPGKKAKRKR